MAAFACRRRAIGAGSGDPRTTRGGGRPAHNSGGRETRAQLAARRGAVRRRFRRVFPCSGAAFRRAMTSSTCWPSIHWWPKGSCDFRGAFAVELGLGLVDDFGAGVDGAGWSCRRRCRRGGAGKSRCRRRPRGSGRRVPGYSSAEHDDGRADFQLGVADAAAGFGEAHRLFGAEHVLVELDRGRGVADDQVREHFSEIALWDVVVSFSELRAPFGSREMRREDFGSRVA